MWLTMFAIYYALNFIATWWFVSNLGVKHTPQWHEYITNMFRAVGQLEMPRRKEDFWFIGLFFAVSFIAIPYLIYASISCIISDIQRKRVQKQYEEEATRNREQIIKTFIVEKKRKAGLDEK